MIYRHNKHREDRLLKWLKELRLDVNHIYLSTLYDLELIAQTLKGSTINDIEINKFSMDDDFYDIDSVDNTNSIEVASHQHDHEVRVNPSESLNSVNVVIQRGEIVEMTSGYVTLKRIHVEIEDCMRESREKTKIYRIKKTRKRFMW